MAILMPFNDQDSYTFEELKGSAGEIKIYNRAENYEHDSGLRCHNCSRWFLAQKSCKTV